MANNKVLEEMTQLGDQRPDNDNSSKGHDEANEGNKLRGEDNTNIVILTTNSI